MENLQQHVKTKKDSKEIFSPISYSYKIMNHNFIERFETKRAPQ